jgi:hypothetical protein
VCRRREGELSAERDLLLSFLRMVAAVAANKPPPPVAVILVAVTLANVSAGAEGFLDRLRRSEDERDITLVGAGGLVGGRSRPKRDFIACEKEVVVAAVRGVELVEGAGAGWLRLGD